MFGAPSPNHGSLQRNPSTPLSSSKAQGELCVGEGIESGEWGDIVDGNRMVHLDILSFVTYKGSLTRRK